MRGYGGQCSWQLQGPLAAGRLAGHGLLRGHKPGVPAGLHKAWGRSWGECGRGATPHHVEAEVAPPAPSGSCVPSHRSPRARKPWRHWDFRTQGERRLHNERPEPRAAGARREARADGKPRTGVGAPDGTQRALRRGREQGKNRDARAGQCRGGSHPLWRLRREVIWEARGGARLARGPGNVRTQCPLKHWRHSAGTAAGGRKAGPGDPPELDAGVGAVLGSSSTTEKAFWRLMVSSSW